MNHWLTPVISCFTATGTHTSTYANTLFLRSRQSHWVSPPPAWWWFVAQVLHFKVQWLQDVLNSCLWTQTAYCSTVGDHRARSECSGASGGRTEPPGPPLSGGMTRSNDLCDLGGPRPSLNSPSPSRSEEASLCRGSFFHRTLASGPQRSVF